MDKLSFVLVIPLLLGTAKAQQAKPASLQDTFNWMTNTLRSGESNNSYIHHPYRQPYSKEWIDKEINPYHEEIITQFSHEGCQVKLVVNVIDNDMGVLLGKQFSEIETDTFDLKNIDPHNNQSDGFL